MAADGENRRFVCHQCKNILYVLIDVSCIMNCAPQFSENKLMETYTKFINNFMQAKSNIQIAKEQLPMFAKFLGVRNFILILTTSIF